jgi:hypothetical protein
MSRWNGGEIAITGCAGIRRPERAVERLAPELRGGVEVIDSVRLDELARGA